MRARRGGRAAAARRAGFTLVEVIFAISLLGGVLLGFAAFTRTFVRASNGAVLRSTAIDLAVAQIEAAKTQGTYAGVGGLAGTEPAVPDPSNPQIVFARRTIVVRDSTVRWDYRTVTVVVTHPALTTAVRKTTVIAAF